MNSWNKAIIQFGKHLFHFHLNTFIEKYPNAFLFSVHHEAKDELVTEVSMLHDPIYYNFSDVIQKEINGLSSQNHSKVLKATNVSENASVLGRRFVLAFKDEGTSNKFWNASFVVKGHKDSMKSPLVHNISDSREHSLNPMFLFPFIFQFRNFLRTLHKLNCRVERCSREKWTSDCVKNIVWKITKF